MELQISGKQIDIGDALRTHVSDRLESGVEKYFDHGAEGHVAFAREGHDFRCDTSIHLSSGIMLQSHGQAGDIYSAFEEAAEHLETRLRRYKRRLKDHHNRNKDPLPAVSVPSYIIQSAVEEAEEPEDLQPAIIAEDNTHMKIMSVGEAVMQMDLSGAPVVIFKTEETGAVNVVYRRDDGNIGWVDAKA